MDDNRREDGAFTRKDAYELSVSAMTTHNGFTFIIRRNVVNWRRRSAQDENVVDIAAADDRGAAAAFCIGSADGFRAKRSTSIG